MKDMMKKIKAPVPTIDVQFHRKLGFGVEPITSPRLFDADHRTHTLPAKQVQRWQLAFWNYRDAVRAMQSIDAEVQKSDEAALQ